MTKKLHQRLWLRGERRSPTEIAFDDAVLLVIDELATPNPSELTGHILIDEHELAAFLRPSTALDKLITLIGDRGTFEDAVKSGPAWDECLTAARSLRSLLHRQLPFETTPG